jgi:hypothetical protein
LVNTKACKQEIIDFISVMEELVINKLEEHSNEKFMIDNRFEYGYFFSSDIKMK